jgi:ankyrin repeat protein
MKYIKLFEKADLSIYDIFAMHPDDARARIFQEIQESETNIEIIQQILDYSSIDVNASSHGMTPLLKAIGWEKTEVVELLLQHPNIDPNKEDNRQRSPLIWSCSLHMPDEITQLLLNHPLIDPNKTTKGNISPLIFATNNHFEEKVTMLLKHPLIDPNIQDHNSHTALIYACSSDYRKIAEAIILHPKTNPFIETEDGHTAWFYMSDELKEKFPHCKPNN